MSQPVSEEVVDLKLAWQQGQDTGKDEPVYVAGWLEEAVCGCVGSVPAKSHNKLIGRLLIEHFFSRFRQVNTQRKAIVQLILEKRELLVGQRVKRDGGYLEYNRLH